MTKILCTLVLLFLGPGAISSQLDLSDLSEDHETVISSAGEAQEIAGGFEVEFSAGLHKDLHKTRTILNLNFTSFCEAFPPGENVPGEFREIIPNLNTAKIIYPFHSFL